MGLQSITKPLLRLIPTLLIGRAGCQPTLTQKDKQTLQEKIQKIWEKELKNNQNQPLPQEKTITLKHNKWQIPILIRTHKASREHQHITHTGLTAPKEILKDLPNPHLSPCQQYLLSPNTPQTQEILALGFPSSLETIPTLPKIKLTNPP